MYDKAGDSVRAAYLVKHNKSMYGKYTIHDGRSLVLLRKDLKKL